jgi:hypothetical protein
MGRADAAGDRLDHRLRDPTPTVYGENEDPLPSLYDEAMMVAGLAAGESTP